MAQLGRRPQWSKPRIGRKGWSKLAHLTFGRSRLTSTGPPAAMRIRSDEIALKQSPDKEAI